MLNRIIFFITLSVLSVAANATVISFGLNYEFSGASAPSGSGPWLTATFDDQNSAGSVSLTLESHLQGPDEFFGSFYFNTDPVFNAATLGIGASDPLWSSITLGNDCCQADGSGLYDARINFYANAFGGSDIFNLELTGSGITADTFNFLNTPNGGNGIYHAAAHVQGIDPNADFSGWIGDSPTSVPEPSTLLLLGVGMLGFGFSMKARRK